MTGKRFATIDIGTNSVLMLIAEKRGNQFVPLIERAEITRLGRGVDATGLLDAESVESTIRVLTGFASQAREHQVEGIAVTATSAARDAKNGADFLASVKTRAGLEVEIISGDEEARLSFAAAWADFSGAPLVVLDIGGGSTELIYGNVSGAIQFRHSFDIGSVRLTERFQENVQAIEAYVEKTLAALPAAPRGARLVGVAGTVTTVCAVAKAIEPYDASKVHGAVLTLEEVARTVDRLAALPLVERKKLPGLQPQRADVIVAGAAILKCVMQKLFASTVTVSDRGLRWGLLAARFQGAAP